MLAFASVALFFAIASFSPISGDPDVLSVAIVTRHGDRYTNVAYPGDPFESLFAKTGYGVLTPRGRVQMYTVGKNLREKFPQLINRTVTVLRSSDVDRTRETIQLLAQGLDGPTATLNHKEINVTQIDGKEDPLLNHASVNCSRRVAELADDVNMQLLDLSYPAIWATVAPELGVSSQATPIWAYYYLDAIYTEYALGLPMPAWATDKLFQRLSRAIDLEFYYTSLIDIEGKLSGVFYEDVINKFKQSLDSKNISFFAYGTHDTTLSPLMVHLDLWPDRRPSVGESLIFVLKTDGSLEVYFYQRDHTMVKQKLPGCDEKVCTLQSFEKAVKHLIPKDWKAECNKV